MSDHDPLCELAGTHSRDGCCGSIAKVRADLRAEVMSVSEMWSLPGDYEIWIKRSDVLAMLDGGSDE